MQGPWKFLGDLRAIASQGQLEIYFIRSLAASTSLILLIFDWYSKTNEEPEIYLCLKTAQ